MQLPCPGGAGAGVTAVVSCQSLAQLEAVYGRSEAAAILSTCTSQVCFPPRDTKTARFLSDLFGEALRLSEPTPSPAAAGLPTALTQAPPAPTRPPKRGATKTPPAAAEGLW